jgi:hypothetical protein
MAALRELQIDAGWTVDDPILGGKGGGFHPAPLPEADEIVAAS